jgi:hypothetical protein
MVARPTSSAVVTLRVSREFDRAITREARRRRRTRSALLREILERALAGGAEADPAAEARRQSFLVSRRASEREALEFVESAADRSGGR